MRRKNVIWIVGAVFVLLVALLLEERHGLLEVGAKAPEFSASLGDGSTVSLSQFSGRKNVVLFFYPRDFTSGCTAQACSMRDGYADLSKHDVVVFGVSADGRASHEKFRSAYNLPFELVADTNRTLIKAYGAGRFGGLLNSTKRVTYVIDKKGVVRLVAHHEITMENHLRDVLSTLKSLN